MGQLVRHLYRLLIGLACVSMVAAFVIVLLGILARQVTFIDIQGWMPTQAMPSLPPCFCIAHGAAARDHIRVTLVPGSPGCQSAGRL